MPSIGGSILTISLENFVPSIGLVNSRYQSWNGEQFGFWGQPQYARLNLKGPKVTNWKLCAEAVVSGPSADGVPFSTFTTIGEAAGSAFSIAPSAVTARNASQRPGCDCLTALAIAASASISVCVAKRKAIFWPRPLTEIVRRTDSGLIAWSKRRNISASRRT